jgi:gliding motility-associated-like protein
VDPVTGIISTLAGSNVYGHSGDGGLAVNANLLGPVSVEVDTQHNLYVLEYDEPRLRKINASDGIINTIAGTGGIGFTGDGDLATLATFNYPTGTVLGFNGSIYIADISNNRVRKLTTTKPQTPELSEINVAMLPEFPCEGTELKFTATIINPGSQQQFQWYINNIPAGTNNATFTTTEAVTGDLVKCVYTSTHCSGEEVIESSEFPVLYGSGTTPSVSLTSTAAKVCPGESITISASVQNGTNVTYQWYKNDVAVGSNLPQFTYSPDVVNDMIRCDISSEGCGGGVISSETVSVGSYETPLVSVTPEQVSVRPGSTVELSANVVGPLSEFMWVTSEPLVDDNVLNVTTTPVVKSHPVIFVGKTIDGCLVKDTSNISIFIKMAMPNAFSPNRDGKNDVFRIPPDVTLQLEEFSVFDRWGKKIFTTSDITKGWTGEDAVSGTYVYMITGEIEGKKVLFKGTVVLTR